MSALPPKADIRYASGLSAKCQEQTRRLNVFSRARAGRFDRTAAFSPILEGADVVHLAVAHILEHLAAERRAPARRAIEDDGLVLGKILVVVGRLGVGAEFQHAAR